MINSIWTNKSSKDTTTQTSNNTTLIMKANTTGLKFQASMNIRCRLVKMSTAKKITAMNVKMSDLTMTINKHSRNSFRQRNKSSKQSDWSGNTLKTIRDRLGLTRSLRQTINLFSRTPWRSLSTLQILLLSGNARRRFVHHQMSQSCAETEPLLEMLSKERLVTVGSWEPS